MVLTTVEEERAPQEASVGIYFWASFGWQPETTSRATIGVSDDNNGVRLQLSQERLKRC